MSLLQFSRGIVATEGLWQGLWLPGIKPNVCFQVTLTLTLILTLTLTLTLHQLCCFGCRLGSYPILRDA